jgi:hypothetical protein
LKIFGKEIMGISSHCKTKEIVQHAVGEPQKNLIKIHSLNDLEKPIKKPTSNESTGN